MVQVHLFPGPDATLAALEGDSSRALLLEAVNRVLDMLEVDPTDDRLRRQRFQNPPLWCVKVVAIGEEWIILWRRHPTDRDIVVVQYVGPASFA